MPSEQLGFSLLGCFERDLIYSDSSVIQEQVVPSLSGCFQRDPGISQVLQWPQRVSAICRYNPGSSMASEIVSGICFLSGCFGEI